ncbi:MAG: hypothetical protein B6241_09800 [Spirochaetaceae bacterium 4572_59]|nr:MAG: hypothetical protein B6241_09800 [Spirochaetaceae bacterium 4572_59]
MTEISTEESALSRYKRKAIGAFFTPAVQADYMVRRNDLHKKWAKGASILDPTAGRGSLLESLIRVSREEKIEITPLMLKHLHGVEREEEFPMGFPERMSRTWGVNFSDNPIRRGDILSEESDEKADIIFGNPPWVNFTDLPDKEKDEIKPYFLKYGLAQSAGTLLLGNSRIDLAALIIMKTLHSNLKRDGEAYFFIPLSLILNEGAHNVFRKGELKNNCFSLREIWDYNGFEIFPGVTARCGLIHLKNGIAMEEKPIPYHSMRKNSCWKDLLASPIAGRGSAYISRDPRKKALPPVPQIGIPKESIPRQGVNTGGRNSLFIFNSCIPGENGLCTLSNKEREVLLPQELIYPLLTAKQFKDQAAPCRYIFMPYSSEGRVLSSEELKLYPSALKYIENNRKLLISRKGVMLQSQIKKGTYWSLMGVGAYTFFPWKIIWEAYGKKEFTPCLFGKKDEKPWIPNQALQAFCPFKEKETALKFLKEFKNPAINILLQNQNMQGTCNWAQPGRIKVFLDIQ